MPSRRTLLGFAAAAALPLAGAGGWLLTRRPSGALEPWSLDAARQAEDPRLRAAASAILSPNPHNRQPWLVALDAADPTAMTLSVDLNRLLPVTDPFGRQIVIGLGCFLETLAIAAAGDGFRAEITPFPEGADDRTLDARPIARVRLAPGAARDPLIDQIAHRRSYKEPFDMAAAPDAAALARIVAAAERPGLVSDATAEPARTAAIRNLMWRGHLRESETPAALRESVDLMRIGRREIEASPDGIDLGGPMLETLSVLGLLDRAQIADPSSEAYAQGLAHYDEMIRATPAAFWTVSAARGRTAEIEVGRAFQRAALTATALGLSLHPISQTLQEYPEMDDLYREARAMFGAPDAGAVQMLARVGRLPNGVDPSPRWPLAARLLDRSA